MTIQEVVEDMKVAVYRKRNERGPGMRVPYHGPLTSAVPSVLKDVTWWIEQLEGAEDANFEPRTIEEILG